MKIYDILREGGVKFFATSLQKVKDYAKDQEEDTYAVRCYELPTSNHQLFADLAMGNFTQIKSVSVVFESKGWKKRGTKSVAEPEPAPAVAPAAADDDGFEI
jgi:hypothetical protein